MILVKMLFRCLYIMVHFVVWIVLGFQNLLSRLSNLVRFGNFRGRDTAAFIRKSSSSWEKKPGHLAFVVDKEEVDSVDNLAKAVAWATVVEIPFVSVYDAAGYIRARYETKLLEEAEKHLSLIKANGSPSLPEFAVEGVKLKAPKENFDKDAKETKEAKDAAKPTSYHTQVLLLSAQEGRWAIVNTAKNICQAVEKGELKPQDVNYENFRENIGAVPSGWPDPDLVVKLGNDTVVNAFLPWHIRLAEIVAVGPLRSISLPQFISALAHYGRVQQRFGK